MASKCLCVSDLDASSDERGRPPAGVFDPWPPSPDPAWRATASLLSHLEEEVSIDVVARAAGLSVRSLYRVIRHAHGTSPVAMRRHARLVLAQRDLRAADAGTTVTGVALRWGFVHLGRFSRDYLRAFDELPSATLRRARADRVHQVSCRVQRARRRRAMSGERRHAGETRG